MANTITTLPDILTLMNEAARVSANHLEAARNHLTGALENAQQQSLLLERLLVTFYGEQAEKPPRAKPSPNGDRSQAAKAKRHEERLALLAQLPRRFEPKALHAHMPLRRVGVFLAAAVHKGSIEAQADGTFLQITEGAK